MMNLTMTTNDDDDGDDDDDNDDDHFPKIHFPFFEGWK